MYASCDLRIDELQSCSLSKRNAECSFYICLSEGEIRIHAYLSPWYLVYGDSSMQNKHTENLPEIMQNFLSDIGCIDWQVVDKSKCFQTFVFTISFFFFFSSRNRQRKLGTKLQWSHNFLCVDLEPSSPILKHTHAYNTTTLENHHFGLTRLFGVKGNYRWWKSAWTCPGACSLTKSVHTPLLLVQLALNALQCMQDCARGLL